MKDHEYIASRMTEEALLCQIAEEAAELAQAALKMRRVIAGDNPTPVTEPAAMNALVEEIADVNLSINEFIQKQSANGQSIINYAVAVLMREKSRRWADRLKAAENKTKEGGENAEN